MWTQWHWLYSKLEWLRLLIFYFKELYRFHMIRGVTLNTTLLFLQSLSLFHFLFISFQIYLTWSENTRMLWQKNNNKMRVIDQVYLRMINEISCVARDTTVAIATCLLWMNWIVLCSQNSGANMYHLSVIILHFVLNKSYVLVIFVQILLLISWFHCFVCYFNHIAMPSP